MKMSARWAVLLLAGWGGLGLRAEPSVLTTWGKPTAMFSSGIRAAEGSALFFTAGMTAGKEAPLDVKAQALLTMAKLKDSITAAGYTLSDVVMVRAYLVPGADGVVDYAGWNAAWNETFNHPGQPHKPSRTSLAVPRLGSPTTLVEIEYVCAGPNRPERFAGSDQLGLPLTQPHVKPYGAKTSRISSGMGVTAGSPMYWTAGVLAGKDGGADTKTQARQILQKLKDNLAGAGLKMSDVVFLRCFVGPDKAQGGKFDLEGWNAAYDEFFNLPENPHKPARTTVTTPSFSGESLLEIELVAAYPGAPAPFAAEAEATKTIKAFGEEKAVISSGVAVASNAKFYFSSGIAGGTQGDLRTQATLTLTTLKAQLAEAGMSLKDVVFLRAYLVPEADGTVDRKTWNEVYGAFFNHPGNPHKPARTTIVVTSLPAPGLKIEIDLIAAKR